VTKRQEPAVEPVEEQTIRIKAASKGNGLTSLLVGGVAIIVGFILLGMVPQQFVLVAIAFIAVGIIGLVIGFFKLKEPEHSLIINPVGIRYHHRYGTWFIPWDNIQRIDTPRVTRGLEQVDLSMVGFRIKSYSPLFADISQRLMTNLLMEQRPLLMQNTDPSCQTGQCPSSDLMEEQKHKLPEGDILTGVQGMFANRMQKLRDRLGYDIYVNGAELDRTADEFVALVRACHEDVKTRLN
jgi:hypothetical protein